MKIPTPLLEKPTSQDLLDAVELMREMIPFFPKSDKAGALIAAALRDIVENKAQLDTLTTQAVRMRKWTGVADLEEVQQRIFGESWQEKHARETAARIEQWKREATARPPSESEISSAVKPIPAIDRKKLKRVKQLPSSREAERVIATAPRKPARTEAERARELEKFQQQVAEYGKKHQIQTAG